MSRANIKKTIYAPNPISGTSTVGSWMGINWDHRWMLRKGLEAFGLFFLGDMLSQYVILYRFRRAIDARTHSTTTSTSDNSNKTSNSSTYSSSSFAAASKTQVTSKFWREIAYDWNATRSFRSGLFGALIYMPTRRWWGRAMDRALPFNNSSTSSGGATAAATASASALMKQNYPVVAKRMSMEYSIFVPMTILGSLLFASFCDGRPRDFVVKMGLQLMPLYSKSVGLWVPVQAACLFLLPPWTWTMVTNAATIVWAAMLSYGNFVCQKEIYGTVLPKAV